MKVRWSLFLLPMALSCADLDETPLPSPQGTMANDGKLAWHTEDISPETSQKSSRGEVQLLDILGEPKQVALAQLPQGLCTPETCKQGSKEPTIPPGCEDRGPGSQDHGTFHAGEGTRIYGDICHEDYGLWISLTIAPKTVLVLSQLLAQDAQIQTYTQDRSGELIPCQDPGLELSPPPGHREIPTYLCHAEDAYQQVHINVLSPQEYTPYGVAFTMAYPSR